VISQHLLRSIHRGQKRALTLEVMFNNSAIASAIRFGKVESIDNSILTGRSDGMVTLDESVRRLLEDGRISRETARHYMSDGSRRRVSGTKIPP
jgi:twitching motility protein PilT